MQQHPLSAAFPEMDEADYLALRDDIEDHGQREPIIVYQGMVLDGWHRYRACIDLGIKPTQFNFGGDDPVAFVKSENFHRRHLTASQRAAAISALQDYAAQRRPNKGATIAPLLKVVDLAKQAGVSPRTMKDVGAAKRAGLLDPVRDGALTANEAGKIARGDYSKAKPKPESPEEYKSDEPDPIAILSEENDRLNDRLAVAAMEATEEERAAAAETIETLRARIKVLEAELSAVKSSRDSYMAECGEMKKQLAGYKRQLQKLATPPAINGGSFGEHHATTLRPS